MGKAEGKSKTEKETLREVLRVGRDRGRAMHHCFVGCSESANHKSCISFLVQYSVFDHINSTGNLGPR